MYSRIENTTPVGALQHVEQSQLSLTEYAVLGLLAEGPTHGFAISRDLGPTGPMGKILTVRRPLIYRALDRLVGAGLAEPKHTEPGDAGPQRVIHRVTPTGRRRLRRWLIQPVGHVRDIRIELQLKLALLDRSGLTPLPLIRSQQEALQPTLAALDIPTEVGLDHVELWRQYNARAAAAYLEHLEGAYTAAENRLIGLR